MTIFIILIFIISLTLNFVLLWYISKILSKLFFIQDNTETILSANSVFNEHLQEVNEMEMYFGDQTLINLLKHSKHVVEQLEAYSEIFADLYFEADDTEPTEVEEGVE